ncbi:BnaA06g20810D [Brassica napus]|uniref:BnaA06g20810D protein n=2 Tax=Brassica TaxID=3705 RepID=A0A078G9W2_BRANA|nr:BnaA06g20810D [Brassica napus]
MGMMKIIMVTMMMTLLVGTIRETKATSAGYAACVKHCNDLCSPKVGDRNCVPNCIFFTCGPPLPKNIRHPKDEGST